MATMADPRPFEARLSRRALMGTGLGAAALWRFSPRVALGARQAEPAGPAAWRTWLLSSGSELRPAAPGEPSREEIEELLAMQGNRSPATEEVVARWGTGPAVVPWTNLALELIKTHKPSPVRAGRALALLHVALYDAAVATADAQTAFIRPAPSVAEPALEPLVAIDPERSSFPAEHAAVAGAASTVLEYLFPDEPAGALATLGEEAAESRLLAGAAYRSDVEAGLALGRAVGERAVARGMGDGSDAIWDGGGRLTGEGYWQPTPPAFVEQPLDPLAGTWKPWVLESGDQFRPVPPPAFGSPAWEAELAAVQEAVDRRTAEQEAAALFWAGAAGTVTPSGLWTEIARDCIARHGLDLPHAARVLALTTVAMADAFVCCWDAKYAFWMARPITADPSLNVLFPTPPFPSYTSGHSTISAAAATILGHLFPADETDLAARADEAKNSRLWAGIHFPIDNDMGATGGAMVGRLLAQIARADGAE